MTQGRLQALGINQRHGWDFPCNCGDTKAPVYPSLLGFPRTCSSSPKPPVSVSLTPAQESPQIRLGLQGRAGLPVVPDHVVLHQPSHWMVTPESGFLTSWLQHVWPKGPSGHALHNIWQALSLGLRLANFLRKTKILIISFLSRWVSGWVLVGGRYAGKKWLLLLHVHYLSLQSSDENVCGREEGLWQENTFQDLLAGAVGYRMLSTNDLY